MNRMADYGLLPRILNAFKKDAGIEENRFQQTPALSNRRILSSNSSFVTTKAMSPPLPTPPPYGSIPR
jgi:hypothetical protein